jgi:hypothetical protein
MGYSCPGSILRIVLVRMRIHQSSCAHLQLRYACDRDRSWFNKLKGQIAVDSCGASVIQDQAAGSVMEQRARGEQRQVY